MYMIALSVLFLRQHIIYRVSKGWLEWSSLFDFALWWEIQILFSLGQVLLAISIFFSFNQANSHQLKTRVLDNVCLNSVGFRAWLYLDWKRTGK